MARSGSRVAKDLGNCLTRWAVREAKLEGPVAVDGAEQVLQLDTELGLLRPCQELPQAGGAGDQCGCTLRLVQQGLSERARAGS